MTLIKAFKYKYKTKISKGSYDSAINSYTICTEKLKFLSDLQVVRNARQSFSKVISDEDKNIVILQFKCNDEVLIRWHITNLRKVDDYN
ncbi:hypothetical protein Bhyg_11540 [Pseudolycoriella hygida]|uniref:Uncharacterized protein n=1 Tax=Pseudolycoriella hygida TaxID=35572 RepID=A0A9Q0MY76_9DIPT|nr:hypothetical protein Bhyg_11540 [Pseudolycoriella hygida]